MGRLARSDIAPKRNTLRSKNIFCLFSGCAAITPSEVRVATSSELPGNLPALRGKEH